MTVILLHSDHRHDSATHVTIFRDVRTRTEIKLKFVQITAQSAQRTTWNSSQYPTMQTITSFASLDNNPSHAPSMHIIPQNTEDHLDWHPSTPRFRLNMRTRATAKKKPTSVKPAHPLETLLCYNIA